MRILKISLCCFVLVAMNLSTVVGQIRLFNNPRDGIEGPSRGIIAPPSPPPRQQRPDFGRDFILPLLPHIPKLLAPPTAGISAIYTSAAI